MAPRVAIVILNWNGWRDTIECLESLSELDYDPFFIVIVDNGSTDESLSRIRAHWVGKGRSDGHVVEVSRTVAESGDIPPDARVRPVSERGLALIVNESNLGFAKGCNVGMKYSMSAIDAEYILLLNNDTVVDRSMLRALVAVGESDKRIGILGCKILYYDYEGRRDIILYAGGKINPWREIVFTHEGAGEVDGGQSDKVTDTDWCSGAALMIRKQLATENLLNPAYTFGIEDVEYCMNAARKGYRVVYVPSAKVWHKEGASKKKLGKRIRRDVSRYFYFIQTNFSKPVYIYHLAVFFIFVLPRWAADYLSEGGDKKVFATFLAEMKKFLRYVARKDLKE